MIGREILNIFGVYASRYPTEAATVAKALELMTQASGDITDRSTVPAHITSSVLIRQGVASLLLIWHPNLKMWLQPGGHVDPGESLVSAALREALEETGLSCTVDDTLPFDIVCLFVPANPRKAEPDHWHIDFRYLMTPDPAAPVNDPELLTACVGFKELGSVSPSLARLALKFQTVECQVS